MEWMDLINMDVLQLTIIPAVLVLIALVFWFRRSDPKIHSKSRERVRPRFSQADLEENALGEPRRPVRSEEFEISPARVISPEEAATKAQERTQNQEKPRPMFGAALPRSRVVARKANARSPASGDQSRSADEDGDSESESKGERERVVTPINTLQRDAGKDTVPGDDEPLSATVAGDSPPHDKEVASPARDNNPVANKIDRELENGLMLALTVVAQGRQLRGSQVLKAVTASGLSYGKMGIFHFHSPTRPSPRAVFSVANVIEPGTFNLAQMEELSTPGLILFANVTRSEEAMSTFNTMLEKARQLAAALDASVCDSRRSTLSKQGIEHIYSEIGEFQRRSRLAHAAHA